MARIAFIGAGSVTFARRILTDILTWPEHSESSLALMDVDGETLEITTHFVQRLISEQKLGATVTATRDRREAITGADYVITAIDVGGQPLRMKDWQISRAIRCLSDCCRYHWAGGRLPGTTYCARACSHRTGHG